MKLTIFISGVTGGGAEKVTCALASYIVNKGHKVELLTMSDETATYPLDDKVTRYSLLHEKERKNFVYNNSLRFVRFVRYLLSKHPQAYLVMLPTNTIYLLSYKWLTKSKIVAAERNNPSSYKQQYQSKLKRLAHKAEGWIFQTEEQKGWYGDAIGDAKATVIPNAINPDVVRPLYTGERQKVIVTAGRLNPQKNHTLLIEAFAKIADKHPDYNLVIYGEGPNRQHLLEKINKLGLADRILLPGYSTNVVDNVRKASLFVLSSDFEGMPNALMEAMALGVPSISTDCGGGGARFLIDNGVNGLLVPTNDVDALASAMDKLLSNPEYAKSLGTQAHKLCETLAPDKIYGQWEEFIKSVVDK